jgi:hypothetical protein
MQHAYEGEKLVATELRSENLSIVECMSDTNVDWRTILRKGVDWFHLAKDRNQLQGFVNMVMNLAK